MPFWRNEANKKVAESSLQEWGIIIILFASPNSRLIIHIAVCHIKNFAKNNYINLIMKIDMITMYRVSVANYVIDS